MTGGLPAGLLAGWSVAVPMGPMGVYLLTLSTRAAPRVAVGFALGIAIADGAFAALASVAGAAVEAPLRAAAPVLHRASIAVVALLAALVVRSAWQNRAATRETSPPGSAVLACRRAVLLTAVNPTTVLYFVALAASGERARSPWFVLGVFAASAGWQVLLARAGGLLGRYLDPRVTASAGAAAMVVLALIQR